MVYFGTSVEVSAVLAFPIFCCILGTTEIDELENVPEMGLIN